MYGIKYCSSFHEVHFLGIAKFMLKGLNNYEIGMKKGVLKLKDIKRSYQLELLCVIRQIR